MYTTSLIAHRIIHNNRTTSTDIDRSKTLPKVFPGFFFLFCFFRPLYSGRFARGSFACCCCWKPRVNEHRLLRRRYEKYDQKKERKKIAFVSDSSNIFRILSVPITLCTIREKNPNSQFAVRVIYYTDLYQIVIITKKKNRTLPII